MHLSAYDLKAFYNGLAGRIVRRLIREQLQSLWPEMNGLRLMGCGYATPYLRPYLQQAERTFAVMPERQGVHHWPPDGNNLVCLSSDADLPIETNSIDRILLIHSLEFSGFVQPMFEEFWRVLKSNGRLMVIVPNRMGLWARADWSPFGQGTPYSASQVEKFLMEHMFVHERTAKALFVPPFRRDLFLRAAPYFEKAGQMLLPAMGGLHFVEASKQLYAGTGKLAQASSRAAPVKVPVAAADVLRRET